MDDIRGYVQDFLGETKKRKTFIGPPGRSSSCIGFPSLTEPEGYRGITISLKVPVDRGLKGQSQISARQPERRAGNLLRAGLEWNRYTHTKTSCLLKRGSSEEKGTLGLRIFSPILMKLLNSSPSKGTKRKSDNLYNRRC